jgi:hypothetical protein
MKHCNEGEGKGLMGIISSFGSPPLVTRGDIYPILLRGGLALKKIWISTLSNITANRLNQIKRFTGRANNGVIGLALLFRGMSPMGRGDICPIRLERTHSIKILWPNAKK